MRNPWLDIPEADYIGHMNSPLVGQRPVLNRLLGAALAALRPDALLFDGRLAQAQDTQPANEVV